MKQADSASDMFRWRGQDVAKSDDFNHRATTNSRHRLVKEATEASKSVSLENGIGRGADTTNTKMTRLPDSYYEQSRIRHRHRANRFRHNFGGAMKSNVDSIARASAVASSISSSSTYAPGTPADPTAEAPQRRLSGSQEVYIDQLKHAIDLGVANALAPLNDTLDNVKAAADQAVADLETATVLHDAQLTAVVCLAQGAYGREMPTASSPQRKRRAASS